MNHNQPDPRLTLAALLISANANRLTQALKLLRLLEADGYPTTASGADTGARGGGRTITVDGERIPVTSVEAAAINRLEHERRIIDGERHDLEATANGILTMASNLGKEIDRILGSHTPPPAQCRDGQMGKDGAIDWGDATCVDAATKAGMCGKHFMAWYRWRKRNGVSTERMFADASATPRRYDG